MRKSKTINSMQNKASQAAQNSAAQGASESPVVVYGGILSNAAVAAIKFVAAFFTGSSAMLSEGVHSTVDTGNELLLLLGLRRSQQAPDERHPFGHGAELYFWSLIVAVGIFGIGGGMSVYEGFSNLRHPGLLEDPTWNYVVLGVAALLEGGSLYLALRKFVPTIGSDGFWRAVQRSNDTSTITVIFENFAALAGLLAAFLGIFLSHALASPALDAMASIVIGFILAATALLLAYKSKSLLVGETADAAVVRSIRAVVTADPAVADVRRVLTMQLGPQRILLNLDVRFNPDIAGPELAQAVDRLEQAIRDRHADVKHIFIEAQAVQQADSPGSAT